MNRPIYRSEEIPTESRDKEFWADITKENLKYTYNYLIVSQLRKLNPDGMTAVECRVAISKLKVLQELLDFPDQIVDHRTLPTPVVKEKTAEEYFETA
jgi:hypothetical protein